MKNPERIGLIAGWGRFPIVTAKALLRQGCEVHCLGIKGHASSELKSLCTSYREFGVARLGSQRRHMRRLGIHRATMAGKIFKTIMFGRFSWLKHSPDLAAIKYLVPHFITGSKDRGDDALLMTVIRMMADREIEMVPAVDFAPELLVNEGVLTKSTPSKLQWQDIEFGWNAAKEMGRLDIGQSVMVKSQSVIAVEAIEGTDECIRRAGELCRKRSFVVVKVTKPQQDMRFDVPTIGIRTLKTMKEAGARVLAIEADKTIVLDQDEVVSYADQNGISLVSLTAAGVSALRSAA